MFQMCAVCGRMFDRIVTSVTYLDSCLALAGVIRLLWVDLVPRLCRSLESHGTQARPRPPSRTGCRREAAAIKRPCKAPEGIPAGSQV